MHHDCGKLLDHGDRYGGKELPDQYNKRSITMSTNEDYIEAVSNMNERQLLDQVIENPEYLTDSYYHVFADALNKRYVQLTAIISK